MARFSERRAAFRALMEGDRCLVPASVFDPLSVRCAEDVGFEVGMFAGSLASLAVLGDPDDIVITLSEFAEQCRRICRASALPVMVDADHGYGNALNVARTVEELEAAGICGMSIEDTDLPQPFGATGARLISVEEGIGKMRAAVAARADDALVIAGRTSAASINGIEDAIERAGCYESAGVDAIFLIGVKSRADLDAVADAVSLPLILGGAAPEIRDDAKYMSARRVRLCLKGHQTLTASVQAIHATMTALLGGTPPADLIGQPDGELMARLTRKADYVMKKADWLG